jgi:hypothetical protein
MSVDIKQLIKEGAFEDNLIISEGANWKALKTVTTNFVFKVENYEWLVMECFNTRKLTRRKVSSEFIFWIHIPNLSQQIRMFLVMTMESDFIKKYRRRRMEKRKWSPKYWITTAVHWLRDASEVKLQQKSLKDTF